MKPQEAKKFKAVLTALLKVPPLTKREKKERSEKKAKKKNKS